MFPFKFYNNIGVIELVSIGFCGALRHSLEKSEFFNRISNMSHLPKSQWVSIIWRYKYVFENMWVVG